MSIHIKPENRGKFNATKKRTGKTTEQLTHSKNPLTRKRAIFAQNAKKWKHADGGNLFYDGGPDGDPRWYEYIMPSLYIGRKAGEYTAKKLIERQQRKAKEAYAREVANRMTNHTLTREDRDYLRKNHPEIWNAYTVHDDTYNIMDDINDRMAEGKATAADSAYLKKNFPLVYNALTLTPKDSEFDGTYGYKPYIEEFDARDSEFDGAYNAGLKEANKKANGGNLFNWGGGTLAGGEMDYGMRINNKVDKLRAGNFFISKELQGLLGGSGQSSNTGNSNFKLPSDTRRIGDKTWNWQTQSYQTNPNQMSPNFNGNFTPDFRFQGGFQGQQTPPTTLNVNPNNFSTVGKMGKFAYGGQVGMGVNYNTYHPEKKPHTTVFDVMKGFLPDVNQVQGMAGGMQGMQGMGNMGSMTGGSNGTQSSSPMGNINLNLSGQDIQNIMGMFKGGAGGAAAAAPKACGGNLHKCGGNLHCGGGNLFDYGGDFSNGQTMYNTGGTHEENPYEGVQVGNDNQGTPNLVEEGEVRYRDYIFSNRLSLSPELAEKYNIPKKYRDATFAYIAEKMGQESKEREYDPISQRGLKTDMEKLRAAQEEARAIKAQEEQMQQAQQIASELGVSVEDVLSAMQMQRQEAAQQQMMAQQQPSSEEMQMMQQQQMMQEQPSKEEMAAMEMQERMPQEAMPMQGYALGGTLFDYPNYNPSNPQPYSTLFDSYAQTQNVNKFYNGGDQTPYSPEDLEYLKGLYLSGTMTLTPEDLQALFAAYPELAKIETNTPIDRTAMSASGYLTPEQVQAAHWYDDLMKYIVKDPRSAYTLDEWNYGQYGDDTYKLYNPYGKDYWVARVSSPGSKRFYKYPRGAKEAEQMELYNKLRWDMLVGEGEQDWKKFEENLKAGKYKGKEPSPLAKRFMEHYDKNSPEGSPETKFYDKNGKLREDWATHLYKLSFDDKQGPMHNMFGRLGTRYFFRDEAGNPYYVNKEIADQYQQGDTTWTSDKNGVDMWRDVELTGLLNQQQAAAQNAPAGTAASTANDTKTSTTTSSNTPQSKVQNPNNFNQGRISPNYSMFDFVPLWQYLTAGKPDYYQADALVDYTNRLPKLTYKPIGDFLQYHPFDRQYAANQQNAKTAAMIRNNWNTSGGNRGYAGAMNLATNMQGQLADAEMQRQADASNLAQRAQVATFNRGTNQYNADAFNRLQLSLPQMYNLGLQARSERAREHYMIDKDFGTSKSANLNTFLKNMYARQREAEDAARTKWLADAGVFGELKDPGYPYPINRNNSFLDWFGVNWRKFGKNNNNNNIG